jgi:hypothetical protein
MTEDASSNLLTGNGHSHEAGNDNEADFDLDEPSYQDMLHGNVRRMSNTVSE